MDKINLTRRERGALTNLAKGGTRPQAADALRIERTTLRVHLRNIRKKLGAGTDQEAIDRADALGLLNPAQLPKGVPQEWADLTPRELETLENLINGFRVLSDEELADALTVEPATVRKHLQNIYRKLDIRSRASAALLASKVFAITAALDSAAAA